MATERNIMAEGTVGPGPEGSTASLPESTQAGLKKEEVLANASLVDKERLQVAKGLLGTQLNPDQERAILEAHKIGSGVTGKDSTEAGVYNYKLGQIREKARILKEAGFNQEQIRSLMESGLAGRLLPTEFAAFDPNAYDGDSKLSRIAGKIKAIGNAGLADEGFLYKTSLLLKRLDDEVEVDGVGAQDILDRLKVWQAKADNPFLPYAERVRVEEQARREGGSEFSLVKNVYEYYMSLPMPADPTRQQELADLRNQAKIEVQNLINQADQAGILDDARKRGLEFYKQFKAAKRRDKWGRNKQHTVDDATMQSYHEVFWASSATLKPFEDTLRSAAKYLFDGIVSEAYQELHGEKTPALNIIAKEEFQKIQEQRIRDRKRESKYDVNNYYGRRSYELAAENAAELPEAALELVRDRLAELPDTEMKTVDDALRGIRQELDELLGTNRVHLEKDEGQEEVNEDNPDYKRAKALFEAVTDAVGYEKIIGWDEKPNWDNGGEVAASYVGRFAAGYIGHHDAIYLMRRVARVLLKLRTHKEGTYWTGHPFSEEKVDFEAMQAYRKQLQEEIIEDAAAHELFITDQDFANRFEKKIGKDGKPEKAPDGRDIISRDLRYSFEDNIENLLLDPGDVRRAAIIGTGDAEALTRHDIRIKVFRDIKARRDEEDGLVGMTPEQRNNAMRQKIIQKMQEKMNSNLLGQTTKVAMAEMNAARQKGDIDAFDKAMWQWVEKYDRSRGKQGLHIEGDANWYPSGWDLVRMKIDRPEKLVDRQLNDEQLDAMYEEAQLDNLTEDEKNMLQNEARFQFTAARDYALLEMEDALYGGIRTRIRDPKTGEIIDPSHKVRRVFDIVQERLEQAITEEWDYLEDLKTTMGADIANLEAQGKYKESKAKQTELDKKILGAQFLVTHAFKAAGLVDGKLPVWNGQLRSDTAINFLGKVLADYGVNVAFGEKISHNNKDLLYELLERGRRAWQSEWNIAAQEEMVGTYPVPELDYDTNPSSPTYGQLVPQYDATGKAIKAKAYRKNVYGDDVYISERNRIVNPGSPNEHQGITDPRFNSSTSGGIAVPEFTDELADYLFAVSYVKNGTPHINALHGYLKGLDEVQALRIQKIFTSNDAVYNEKERIAAYNAKKAFMGGKNAEGKSEPGFGNEPYHGGFKAADWLIKQLAYAEQHDMHDLSKYLHLMQGYRDKRDDYSVFLDTYKGKVKYFDSHAIEHTESTEGIDLEKFRQFTYLDFDKLSKQEQDDFYQTIYGIYDYFQEYLKARKGCIQSRGGRALRSWEEENYKAFYAFRRETREAIMGKKKADGTWKKKPEQGFIIRLGYSPEVASEAAIRMLEVVLQDADYLDLRGYEVDQRIRDGVDILYGALTADERKAGFVIPDEKDWTRQRPEIKKALETIRRRGLLEFMREEGYIIAERDDQGNIKYDSKTGKPIYYKEVLGQKIPPLVQDETIKEDSRKLKNAFNP